MAGHFARSSIFPMSPKRRHDHGGIAPFICIILGSILDGPSSLFDHVGNGQSGELGHVLRIVSAKLSHLATLPLGGTIR